MVDAASLPAFEPLRLKERFSSETVVTLETFASFLQDHTNVTVFVEIKEESIANFGRRAVCDAIERPLSEIQEQVVIISFDVDIIATFKSRGMKTGVVLRSWDQINSPQILAVQPDYLFINVKSDKCHSITGSLRDRPTRTRHRAV